MKFEPRVAGTHHAAIVNADLRKIRGFLAMELTRWSRPQEVPGRGMVRLSEADRDFLTRVIAEIDAELCVGEAPMIEGEIVSNALPLHR